jgi:hypothetical protein
VHVLRQNTATRLENLRNVQRFKTQISEATHTLFDNYPLSVVFFTISTGR